MTNSEKQEVQEGQEEKPSGRPIKGVKKERWNGMLPIDVIAYLDHLKPGKRSARVAKAMYADPECQAWIDTHWKPKHSERN